MPYGEGALEKGATKHSLLFEMLRSFTTLAETLNLSHAVARLDSTRQTVRRHIALLEEMRGGALFEVKHRQYVLTEFGRQELPGAIDLLLRAAAWTEGQFSTLDGLQRIHAETDDGWFFHLQQHNLLDVNESGDQFLPDILKAWATSGGQVEHSELKRMRGHTLIFRRIEEHWRFIEVGEHGGFAKWVGLNYARAAVGRMMDKMPAGRTLETMVQSAYEPLERTGGARYDHVYTVLPRGFENAETPVCYQRLLLAVRLADHSTAIMSATRLTQNIQIEGVPQSKIKEMPKDLIN